MELQEQIDRLKQEVEELRYPMVKMDEDGKISVVHTNSDIRERVENLEKGLECLRNAHRSLTQPALESLHGIIVQLQQKLKEAEADRDVWKTVAQVFTVLSLILTAVVILAMLAG